MVELAELLEIEPGVTAVTGSGGKTTLVTALTQELRKAAPVILTTTTHMLPPSELVLCQAMESLPELLAQQGAVCLGQMEASGKIRGLDAPFSWLLPLAPYILVEADGARGLPMKAHRKTEPVIPPETRQVIGVFGAAAFGKPVAHAVHCPELAAEKLGCSLDETVTAELAARLLRLEGLPDRLVVNQAEGNRAEQARALARLLPEIPVFAGSLREGEIICLR